MTSNGKQGKFEGFPKQSVTFLRNLKQNNNKQWFTDHKKEYDSFVIAPARQFVTVLGSKMRKIAKDIHAEPQVDRSIFRIYRDVRFSKDKSPYKTHLGIFLWEGPLKKMESSGFYFHLEPPNLMLGVGMHAFSKPFMDAYREAVVDQKSGQALIRAIGQVRRQGAYELGGRHFKKIPAGFDKEHRNAELLLHNGLFFWIETRIPDEFYSSELVDVCMLRFKEMAPVHRWLMGLTEKFKP